MPGAGAFVDEAQIHARAGDGGAGSVSFRRESHVPRGGPDGGDGGGGGDVWLCADHNVSSLLAFRDHPFRRATNGTHGSGGKRHGKRGDDVVVPVPPGTIVRDHTEGVVVADLAGDGDRWLAARGGQGGRGNARFLSNFRRAPSFAEQGEVGEEFYYNLELKLMADVALVGFPNAGKSTLISTVSAAKPKIADYPFTTLEPHLGVVRYDDTEFVMADIPGLIEGASTGKGLGHRFLRHIERARVLLVLVDLGAEMDPAEQLRILETELGTYQPELLERPRLVTGSRADIAQHAWDGDNISAATRSGIGELTKKLATAVHQARDTIPARKGVVVHRPEPEGVRIEKHNGDFIVRGRVAERTVALNDITTPDAIAYVQRRLKSLGVDRALTRAGAHQGDIVHIGGFTFTYEADEL